MFRRQTKPALNNGRRWLSHRSGPRKFSYALTRGAAVATSVAAVAAAATIASQKFMEGGSIHNDAAAAAFAGSKVDPRTTAKVRVDGGNDEEQLSLLVWGSNR
jgi:hypothetical protein